MALPVTLLLGQLSLWYQARPLKVGEEAVLTMALGGDDGDALPEVRLRPADAVEVPVGPVRIRSRREVCWTLRGRAPGVHRLVFDVGGLPVAKQAAVGDGFLRVRHASATAVKSAGKRPGAGRAGRRSRDTARRRPGKRNATDSAGATASV